MTNISHLVSAFTYTEPYFVYNTKYMSNIRTRFAPSPTGQMHVGGLRTALFAWLVAKQGRGQFILRLEDTDKNREVEGSAEHIMQSLSWLGLDWDEGIGKGGEYGPYLQSERLDIYKEWAQKLVDTGRAYADPYTPEELDSFRKQAQADKQAFLFRDHRPENPPLWDGTKPLRLKSEPKDYSWHDAVMGELSTGPEVIDDFILMKSDGYPTYNFAHIIDDHLMKISHVIRSQEFLASVPKYLNLYEALGIESPVLATVPYVMAPDGKKKLSKRDGAKDILDYANEGYMPEALMNFIATLGWNDGTEQEVFSIKELIEKFSLERVQKSGAKFDDQRLTWINGYHVRQLPLVDLYEKVTEFWPSAASEYDDNYKKQVLRLVQERLKFFAELPGLTAFFFEEPTVTQELLIDGKVNTPDIKPYLEAALNQAQDSDFTHDDLEKKLRALCDKLYTKPGILFSLIRRAVTGSNVAPGIFETLEVLGKDRTIKRLHKALALL